MQMLNVTVYYFMSHSQTLCKYLSSTTQPLKHGDNNYAKLKLICEE